MTRAPTLARNSNNGFKALALGRLMRHEGSCNGPLTVVPNDPNLPHHRGLTCRDGRKDVKLSSNGRVTFADFALQRQRRHAAARE